jgi:hypothetical protein
VLNVFLTILFDFKSEFLEGGFEISGIESSDVIKPATNDAATVAGDAR